MLQIAQFEANNHLIQDICNKFEPHLGQFDKCLYQSVIY